MFYFLPERFPPGSLENQLLGNSEMLETVKEVWETAASFPLSQSVSERSTYFLPWNNHQWFFEVFSGSDHLGILLNTDSN